MTELSKKLVAVRDAALTLRPAMDYVDPNESENDRKYKRLKRWDDAAHSLYETAEFHRPFYPENIYRAYQGLSKVIWQEVTYFRIFDRSTPNYWEKAEQNAKIIQEHADKTLDAIRERIKNWECLDKVTGAE